METANQLTQDVDTVARAEIVAAIEYGLSSGDISHESCPEIGAFDWEQVEKRIMDILVELAPDGDERASAYQRMLERVYNND